MPQPPALSLEQRQAALAKAAEVRRARAALKQQLKDGSVSLADVFAQADTDPVVAGIKMAKVLESLPAVGKVKTKRLMESIGIAPSRRVRGVGAIQRARLLETFPPSS